MITINNNTVKNLRNVLLTGVAVLALASCEKYDDSGITGDLDALEMENAKLKLALETIELTPGADGIDGVDGVDGADGVQGLTGANGDSITIVSIETSTEGSLVLFSDGSELFVDNGTSGLDGADGTNGSNGINGTNGSNGSQGIAGNDGAVGATGAVGGIGATGSAGATGTIGLTGLTGDNGQDASQAAIDAAVEDAFLQLQYEQTFAKVRSISLDTNFGQGDAGTAFTINVDVANNVYRQAPRYNSVDVGGNPIRDSGFKIPEDIIYTFTHSTQGVLQTGTSASYTGAFAGAFLTSIVVTASSIESGTLGVFIPRASYRIITNQ